MRSNRITLMGNQVLHDQEIEPGGFPHLETFRLTIQIGATQFR